MSAERAIAQQVRLHAEHDPQPQMVDFSGIKMLSLHERKAAWAQDQSPFEQKQAKWAQMFSAGVTKRMQGEGKEFWERVNTVAVGGVEGEEFTVEHALKFYERYFTGDKKDSNFEKFSQDLQAMGDLDGRELQWLLGVFGKRSGGIYMGVLGGRQTLPTVEQVKAMLPKEDPIPAPIKKTDGKHDDDDTSHEAPVKDDKPAEKDDKANEAPHHEEKKDDKEEKKRADDAKDKKEKNNEEKKGEDSKKPAEKETKPAENGHHDKKQGLWDKIKANKKSIKNGAVTGAALATVIFLAPILLRNHEDRVDADDYHGVSIGRSRDTDSSGLDAVGHSSMPSLTIENAASRISSEPVRANLKVEIPKTEPSKITANALSKIPIATLTDGKYFPVTQGYGRTSFSVANCPPLYVASDCAHHGEDIGTPAGTVLKSPGDGRVTASSYDASGGLGERVTITLNNGEVITLGHLSHRDVRVGDTVHAGSVIAETGATGVTTAPHLHVETRNPQGQEIDPAQVFDFSAPKGR